MLFIVNSSSKEIFRQCGLLRAFVALTEPTEASHCGVPYTLHHASSIHVSQDLLAQFCTVFVLSDSPLSSECCYASNFKDEAASRFIFEARPQKIVSALPAKVH